MRSLEKAIDYISNPKKIKTNDYDTEMMAIERVLQDKDSSKVALDYVMNPLKTDLITGVNCVPETSYEEMLMVKAMHNKLEGRQFIHFVQSFDPTEKVTPQQVHEIGVRLTQEFKRFSGFQFVVATHVDQDHLHNHFIVNTVNMDTGRKWHQSKYEMQQLKDYSDELCKSYGLSITEKKNKNREMPGEYRARLNQQSWKHETRLAVDACMKNSTNREDFISNMQKLGYLVEWTDSRKNITFITPEGKKIRDNTLDKTLTKEVFQKTFSLNKELGDPKAMVDQINQLELATKVSNLTPEGTLVDQVIAKSSLQNLNEAMEEEERIPDPLPEDNSQYFVEWNERYKEARTFFYGSDEVDQNFAEAYRLLLEEALAGNALAMHDLGRMYADGLGVEINSDLSQVWYTRAFVAFNNVESNESESYIKTYAQYRIGKMYAAGLGTSQDFMEAAGWFQKAVHQKHKYAQYSLAGLYYRGQGVEKSFETAFNLYSKSAAQEMPYASYELAKMYRDGLGTGRDKGEADNHFKHAFAGFSALEEENRDDKLQYRLGQMLYTGTGTEKNITKAIDYLGKSVDTGNVNAQYLLAKIYLEAENTENGLTENVQKALTLLEKAADGGNAQAQYALAKILIEGKHIGKDITRAVAFLILSAEQKNQYAAFALGKLFMKGEEVPKDINAAVKWLTLSSDQGNSFAQYSLARVYLKGEEVQQDVKQALGLLEKSSEQENQFAQYTLGKLYLDGEYVVKHNDSGVRLLTASAEQGNQFAQFQLGKMYLLGKDVLKDKEKAIYWLTLSAEQGNEYAKLFLENMSSLKVNEYEIFFGLIRLLTIDEQMNQNPYRYPLSRLEGHALREKILELQFGSTLKWDRGQGYER